MSSENQRRAAKSALKKIADAISENEGRMRILQKGEDAATNKASRMAAQTAEDTTKIQQRLGGSNPSFGYSQFGSTWKRWGNSTDEYGQERLAQGLAHEFEERNPTPFWAGADAKAIKGVRDRGEKITLRRKGIEAKNESLKEEASNIAMTERQHAEKVISDMRARAKKGISTEYADNLMIQGRGTPPADFVPRTTQQEGNLVAKTIGAAGAAGATGYWTRKKESDRAGQK